MKKAMLFAGIVMVALAAPLAVLADETCTGTIGAITIDDNVIVPEDATCILEGTRVEGNVLVEPGATLRATGVEVEGNVQTDDGGAVEVAIADSEIDGDVQVFDSARATVTISRVGGNVQYEDNDSDLEVLTSFIDGDVQLFDNDGGSKEIRDNTIGGNLQCKDNDPAPVGGGNRVEGNAEDQCADLEGTTTDVRFRDVPAGHTFRTEIESLAHSGVTRGCNPPTNDRFCPDDAVTRGQMAAFLVRALGLTGGWASFIDTGGHVFADDIAALAEAGITRGCNPPTNDRFCPDERVTRGQMAAFMTRALGLPEGSASFVDTSGHVFAADIASLADAGITRGCNPPTNDRFCPDDIVTRAQMAAFLVRAGLAG